jgi:hypothetical protein
VAEAEADDGGADAEGGPAGGAPTRLTASCDFKIEA